MLTKRIIACLDVQNGTVVKGRQFESLRDAGDPVALAARYNADGIDEVWLLDISATLEGRRALIDTVTRTAAALFIPLGVGGGIRAMDDAAALFDAGADKVSVNSAALAAPSLIDAIAARYGSQAVVVAIDAKRRGDAHRVFSRAGTCDAERNVIDWAREAADRGAGELLVTSIDRDGTRDGFDCALTAAVAATVNVPVIASGGAGSASHFVEVFTQGRADAALAASVFHFAELSVASLKSHLSACHIAVREVAPC